MIISCSLRRILVCTFFLINLIPFKVSAYNPEFSVIYDRHLSPYSGAELINLSLRSYQYLDDMLLPSSEGQTTLWWWVARGSKLLFIEFPLISLMHITQHELFGHGFRAREFDLADLSYEIEFASGATYFNAIQYNGLHPHQKAALSSAGVEANEILASRIREQWIVSQEADSREALLYFLTYYDQPGYIQSFYDDKVISSGHDIDCYISDVNEWHGANTLNGRSLKRRAIFDHFDPFLWQGLWALGNYLHKGTPSSKLYMINFGEFKWLPGIKMILTPWGPEMGLRNFIAGPNANVIRFDVHYGNTGGKTSFGFDIKYSPALEVGKVSTHSRFYFARQPEIKKGDTADDNAYVLLIAPFVGIDYHYREYFAFTTEIGYKGAGFIPGEPLAQSFIGRLGFKVDLTGFAL